MPIDELHPKCPPPTENICLWRYMDIPSFLSLISEGTLTFGRADKFEDKFEGTLPPKAKEIMHQEYTEMSDAKMADKLMEGFKSHHGLSLISTYLSCWCNSEHEMIHMWKVYSKAFGVAIETDYESLKESFTCQEKVYPALVNYIDFEQEPFNWEHNMLNFFKIKRREYLAEKEFRLILYGPQKLMEKAHITGETGGSEINREIFLNEEIFKCEVDVKKMIHRIHVSPFAPKWYKGLIEGIISKYELNVQVLQSPL